MDTNKAAVYCRVDRGGSPETRKKALELQKRKLEHYAKKKGLQISGYYEDDGFPGHDLERPGLTRLAKDYRAGMFAQVLVIDQSRLYRGSQWREPKWPFKVRSLNQVDWE